MEVNGASLVSTLFDTSGPNGLANTTNLFGGLGSDGGGFYNTLQSAYAPQPATILDISSGENSELAQYISDNLSSEDATKLLGDLNAISKLAPAESGDAGSLNLLA
jgi:hypothetical protein